MENEQAEQPSQAGPEEMPDPPKGLWAFLALLVGVLVAIAAAKAFGRAAAAKALGEATATEPVPTPAPARSFFGASSFPAVAPQPPSQTLSPVNWGQQMRDRLQQDQLKQDQQKEEERLNDRRLAIRREADRVTETFQAGQRADNRFAEQRMSDMLAERRREDDRRR